MTSIQLPSNIALNIWEDSIKMEADTILRKFYKKNYDEVLRQLDLILPFEENYNWYYDPECENMETGYVIPMIMSHDERTHEFDSEYLLFRDTYDTLESQSQLYSRLTSWKYNGRLEKVFDRYDYDTNNNRNDEDLKKIKDRIASILQKSINLVENNKEDESDDGSDYEDDFFD